MDLRGKNIEGGYFNLVTVEGDSNETSGKLQDGQGTDLGNIAIGGLSFNSADSEFSFPAGTTAERPSSPSAGYARYNTDTGKLEIYTGNVWLGIVPEGLVELGVATATVSAQDAEAVLEAFFGQFGTPEAGYSVRQLGDNSLAMRVRRSSDNAETNIGFTADGDLDESALTTFTGANDGFVTTWYNQAVDTETLPADFGSGATASYSLRKVESAYTGNAIKVRRSSDNAEQDIGFVDGELDTSSLETFCGAGDGFVTTWYDQSGSNNATQATAGSQPKIVSSGSTITDNGKPALQFDGTNDSFDTGISSFTTTFEFSTVFNFGSNLDDNSAQGEVIYSNWNSTSSDFWFRVRTTLGFVVNSDDSTDAVSNTASANTQYIGFTTHGSSNNILRINGEQLDSQTGSSFTYSSGDNLFIGSFPNGNGPLNGTIQELLYFDSDQSANRESIEANQASFYDIGISGSHAVQGTAGSQPKIVSSGSVIKENSQPSIDFSTSVQTILETTGSFDNISAFFVGSLNSSNFTAFFEIANGTSDRQYLIWRDTSSEFEWRHGGNTYTASSTFTGNDPFLISALDLGTTIDVFLDASQIIDTTDTALPTRSDLYIGNDSTGGDSYGSLQELIIYGSDKSSDRTNIESNIAGYFNITI